MKNVFAFCKRLAVISGLFYFAACSKCKCVDEDLHPNFISFTPAELKTVVLKRYSKGNGFVTPLDSATFFDERDFRTKQTGDTISFPVRAGNFSLNPNYDWLVSLPVPNRSFRISDIDKQQIRGDCSGKVQCINPVHSLKVEGSKQPLENTAFNFYIRK